MKKSTTKPQKSDWPIIGHQGIVKFLQKSIINNKVAHAYLFCGLEHLGKRTVAEYFAASLLANLRESATNFPKRRPKPAATREILHESTLANLRESTTTIANLHEYTTNNTNDIREIRGKFVNIRDVNIRDLKRHPDFYEIKKEEDKKNISIEQIRKLREKLGLRAFLGEYKVALIDEAESMTEEANNALLKTLEEPSEKTVIILITTNARSLPQTIVSRCQIIRFLPVNRKGILEFLDNHGILRSDEYVEPQDDRGKKPRDSYLCRSRTGSSVRDYVGPSDDRKDSHGILSLRLKVAPSGRSLSPSLQDDNYIVALSQGRPGILINFLENPEELAKYQEKAEEFIKIIESDLGEKWQVIDKILPKGAKFLESQEVFQNLLSCWKSIIRDLLLIKIHRSGKTQIATSLTSLVATTSLTSDVATRATEARGEVTAQINAELKCQELNLINLFLKEKLVEIAERYSSEKLRDILEEIDLTRKYLSWNVNPKLAVENLLLKL